MGIQADTATAVPDGTLGGGDGFTSGDPQVGVPPTQLSDTFLNSIIVEINMAVDRASDGDIALVFGGDESSWQQLGKAICYRVAQAVGNGYDGDPSLPWSRRTFIASALDIERNWRVWMRQGIEKNVANNTVQQTGHIFVPDNSQFWATWEVCVVRTNDVTVYKNTILRASVRRSGGAYTVQNLTTVEEHGGLAATFDVIAHTLNGFSCIAVETTLPVLVGANFNIHAAGHVTNVTTGT